MVVLTGWASLYFVTYWQQLSCHVHLAHRPKAASAAPCVLLQALVRDQLLLDPVPHETAQQQGSMLLAYSLAANQVGRHDLVQEAAA